jgi:hypothetical protein
VEKYKHRCASGVRTWPIAFLIYINDITENLESYSLLYTDDTSLCDIVDNPDASSTKLNNDLIEIEKWAKRWLATINTKKTECMNFSVKRLHLILIFILQTRKFVKSCNSHSSWRQTHSKPLLESPYCKLFLKMLTKS